MVDLHVAALESDSLGSTQLLLHLGFVQVSLHPAHFAVAQRSILLGRLVTGLPDIVHVTTLFSCQPAFLVPSEWSGNDYARDLVIR